MSHSMRYIVTALSLASCIFFGCGQSHAQEEIWGLEEEWESSPDYYWYSAKEPTPWLSDHWEITPETFWFFYEEPSLSVEWEGILYGIRLSYTGHNKDNHLMTHVEGGYAGGSVDYDGFLSDNTPHTDGGTDHIFEFRGLLGYDWAAGKTVVTPFLGLGFRYWFDDLDSVNAYERDVRYLYSPIGIESIYSMNENWRFEIRAEYDFFWRGWVTSHLSDVNPNFNDPRNTQDKGFGVRGSVSIKRLVDHKTTITIEPFIRYWDIDDSDTAAVTFAGTLLGGGYEPANKTIEAGLQISFVF